MFGATAFGQAAFAGTAASGAGLISNNLDFIAVVRTNISNGLDFIARETKILSVDLDFIAQGAALQFTNLDFIAFNPLTPNKLKTIDIGSDIGLELGLRQLPKWSNATRPVSPKLDTIGHNEQLNQVEVYTKTGWKKWTLQDL